MKLPNSWRLLFEARVSDRMEPIRKEYDERISSIGLDYNQRLIRDANAIVDFTQKLFDLDVQTLIEIYREWGKYADDQDYDEHKERLYGIAQTHISHFDHSHTNVFSQQNEFILKSQLESVEWKVKANAGRALLPLRTFILEGKAKAEDDKTASTEKLSSEVPIYMRFKLTQAEKVWLEAVYAKLRNNEEVVPTQMIAQHWEKLPKDFKYKDIDPRLIFFGVDITLLGILQIDPDTDLVSKTDRVIRRIRQAIIKDSKIDNVNSEAIAASTGLSKYEVSIIFGLLQHLGNFWNGGASNNSVGYRQINIGYEAAFREYLNYEGIDALLLKLYQRKDLRISISEDEQPRESVKIVLDFPEEVEVYCEQYLVYFVQFLKDLGVSATSELKHEAGKVLFSVTPTDQNEALDKIRAALEVYLALPGEKLTHSADNPIEVQRLTANIHHLQGQLSIAQAVLQAKEATIQAQQISINNLLSENVIDITPKPDDKEEFLGGALALTQIEKGGVRLNLAEIFRMLKRWFQED